MCIQILSRVDLLPDAHSSSSSLFSFKSCRERHFFDLSQLIIFKDAAMISMGLGDLGTLGDAIRQIHSLKASEQEALVALIVKQVLMPNPDPTVRIYCT